MPDPNTIIKAFQGYAKTFVSTSEELTRLAENFSNTAKDLTKEKLENQDTLEGIAETLDAMEATLAQTLQAIQFTRKGLPEKEELTENTPQLRERSLTLNRITDIMDAEDKDEPFSDFLATIGNAVVKSQEALDERSRQYLQSIRDRPYIPPTLFRIPKISASLKVGLKSSKASELNVLIASRKDQMDELNEQNINFEIAAVPPTPELLKMLEDQAPRIEFLFNATARKTIFSELEEIGRQEDFPAKLKLQLDRMLEPANKTQVVIWPLGIEETFIILFAGENSDEDVAVWYYDRPDKGLISIIRADLKSKIDEDQNPLRKFVLKMGRSQAVLLGP